jgi:4-diphosphocytidyl-2-C-methyl-D-erythritol kinase
MRVVLPAPAKINLDLRVLGRRADGYHELRTIFQALRLHDTVTVEASRGPFTLDGDGSRMPLDRTNLAWRAADALWAAAGRKGDAHGVRMRLQKRIPSRAGLGGGSSDAAAALVALTRLWRLRMTRESLLRVAAELGADVPFFLVGGTALGLGRGEQLFPLPDLPSRIVVLALPDLGVSTADAYGWLAEARANKSGRRLVPDGPGPPAWIDLVTRLDACRNDLETAVEPRHPVLTTIRTVLETSGAESARMSGSGSAVFGLFRQSNAARRAVALLKARGVASVVTSTRPARPGRA